MEVSELLRTFKRTFHRTRKIYEELCASNDELTLKLAFENGMLTVANQTPNEQLLARFMVGMRPFLYQESELFLPNAWEAIKEASSVPVPIEMVTAAHDGIANLKQGFIGLSIDGKQLSAQDVYELVAEGEYFDRRLEEKLTVFLNSPITAALFRFEFLSYAVTGFQVTSIVFDCLLKMERNGGFAYLVRQSRPELNKCIYCLATEGEFDSEEHIIPESLGNDVLLLPKGYVCSKCNNGVLARLDSYLLKLPPVALAQVQYVPITKQGKLPIANFQNMTFERTSPRNIRHIAKDRSGEIHSIQELPDGATSWKFTTNGLRFDPIQMARCFYKIALGTLALGEGHETACSDRYQLARKFVISGGIFHNNLVFSTRIVPTPECHVTTRVSDEGTAAIIDLFGWIVILNLENEPVLQKPDTMELEQFQFVLQPLTT